MVINDRTQRLGSTNGLSLIFIPTQRSIVAESSNAETALAILRRYLA